MIMIITSLTSREQWIDSYGEHIVLPITIVDQRVNHFHSIYHIRVIRKGQILAEKVGDIQSK